MIQRFRFRCGRFTDIASRPQHGPFAEIDRRLSFGFPLRMDTTFEVR